MTQKLLISIVESSLHPNYSELYRQKDLKEVKVNSIRKAISKIKANPPAYIVAEFFYAYSSNYSGVSKSNLDVLLVSLQKYSPDTKVIVLVEKEDFKYIDALYALDFPVHGVFVHPTTAVQLEKLL